MGDFYIKIGKSDLKKLLMTNPACAKGKSSIFFFFPFPLVYMCSSSQRLEFKVMFFMLHLSYVMTFVVKLW